MTKLKLPEKRVFYGPAVLWKRVLAFVIDFLILDIFVLGFFEETVRKILGDSSDYNVIIKTLQQNPEYMQALTIIFALIVMLTMAYFVLLQYTAGQTVGAILLNIYVVQTVVKESAVKEKENEKEFERAGFLQCVMRNCFLIPVIPFVLFWVADPVYYFFAKKNQRLTEYLSRTKVVEEFKIN
jgi:uncharacterized RDD family membrane protein YckC